MSISPQRLTANRSNALRSTGPRTVDGKLASSHNAVTHGLLTRQPLLADEDPTEFELLSQRLVGAFSPDGVAEELLVDEVVGLLWRLRRVQRVETALYSMGASPPVLEALRRSGETDAAVGVAFAAQAASFSVLSRYETSLVNRLRRTMADLERLQSERETTDAKLVVIAGER